MPYYMSGNKRIELKQSTSSLLVPRLPSKSVARIEGPGEGAGSPALPQSEVLEDPRGTQLLVADQVDAELSSLSDLQRQQLLQKHRARLVRAPSTWHPFQVLSPVDGDPFRLANALVEQEKLMAQPRLHTLLKARIPLRGPPRTLPQRHEDMLELQWGLRLIRAPQAWGGDLRSLGSPDLKVAVIDCGVDLEHPDLNVLDKGYDVLKQTREAPPGSLNQANAHGTACAGIIAATGKHALGVAPMCQLLPIRFAQFEHYSTQYEAEHLAEAIRRAVMLGASVLSISFETWESEVVHRAIQSATSAQRGNGGSGCVVVAGTGNGNGPVRYPAAYAKTVPGVLAVAAVDPQGRRWQSGTDGSCFGEEVSVAAPGTAVWTTDLLGDIGRAMTPSPKGDYTHDFDGTSAACAFAAGAAALVLSANPWLSAGQVCHILQETASMPAGSRFKEGRNDDLGHGIINAEAAVKKASSLPRGGIA